MVVKITVKIKSRFARSSKLSQNPAVLSKNKPHLSKHVACVPISMMKQNKNVKLINSQSVISTPEAVVQRCSAKKVLLEISQNSKENTCTRVYFLIKLRLWQRCFPVNFVKFLRTLFFIEHLWWLLVVLH